MENGLTQKYIAIEGVIGIGKTTLARMLQTHFSASILLEVFEENPFLASFYDDRERYAFQTQIFFLLSRYHQQHQAVPQALGLGNLISDYTFAKDELFAWLNLKDDELAMYGRVHAALSDKIPKPNLIVYLHADHEVTMRRIMLRDRPYERNMDPNYIKEVAAAYEAWLMNLPDIPVLNVDTTNLDFLANQADLDHVITLIEGALRSQDTMPVAAESQSLSLLQNGRLADYQQFHQQLDAQKQFDPDLLFNYMLLTSEMGELADELIKIKREGEALVQNGRSAQEAQETAVAAHRDGLANELADMLAYLLKLANYSGIDLEQAYRDKMRHNLSRTWRRNR
ncbi:MAG: deoxynucleoside kinase [Chloroflexota bacterium]